jgi:hypothetical protein
MNQNERLDTVRANYFLSTFMSKYNLKLLSVPYRYITLRWGMLENGDECWLALIKQIQWWQQ